jgi:hypothetical protein
MPGREERQLPELPQHHSTELDSEPSCLPRTCIKYNKIEVSNKVVHSQTVFIHFDNRDNAVSKATRCGLDNQYSFFSPPLYPERPCGPYSILPNGNVGCQYQYNKLITVHQPEENPCRELDISACETWYKHMQKFHNKWWIATSPSESICSTTSEQTTDNTLSRVYVHSIYLNHLWFNLEYCHTHRT